MVNKVILLGNLGKDPETKTTEKGNTVVNFSLATSEYYNNESHTEWHNVVVWGNTAENCAKFLNKGSKVFLEGKIQTRKWQDKEGNNRYTTEVVAFKVQFLDTKTEKESDWQPDAVHGTVTDENLPF